ncbi:sensor histidine kinase [Clostridium cellulovorans]|uniref:histidine kinase n=1 Tax=Clostridium cellulovorans (strain ATCC 35296 / DSM 3052 / OCM 3 / 743B) TaxID=573061 RepID=D9SMI2_CLOC7|nr:HAMP domain-containing sensor histidine kinase [Clostridium cellulovorans]ADL53838.1 integral membrane sensor signal transduction histidine kinase [Clostridium cellulovorans 743B]
MLRNKEVRLLLIVMFLVSIICSSIGFRINIFAGVITFITCVTLLVSYSLFTLYRYKEIEKLSESLRSICSGEYSLDIRDNKEGELSILKNEIYKVTLMLSKHGEALKKEKENLSDAISDISHQLKTPLTSMMVMTDLLSDSNLKSEKRVVFTKNIQNQLERMEWLLTSLLKLSKIDAGTVKFKKDKISVAEVIERVTKAISIPMDIKEQSIIIEGDTEATFIGDLNWITEAMINIMKNCVEHTGTKGTIWIIVEETPLYTQIKVTDNGSGIDKEDLPYIFKRFYKGKNASEDSVGIGLAMAKTIIASQGGDLSVTSKKNEGTQFSIKIYKQII